jgi:cell division protease FtsH
VPDQDRNRVTERREEGEPRRGQAPPPVRMNRGLFAWLVLIGLTITLFLFLSRGPHQALEKTASELVDYARQGQLEEIVFTPTRVTAKVKPDTEGKPIPGNRIYVNVSEKSYEWLFAQLQETEARHLIKEQSDSLLVPFLLNFLPWLVLLALIWFFLFRGLRNAGAGAGMLGNFGRSRHKLISKEMTNITLADVAGIQEAKDEVGEIVQFLKNPKKFQRLGGRIPRGVLLVGEPGCGKTLLAKAVAGEAEVPFFSISGSDFVEMFVGVGASRVRDLFKQAKDNAPCIVFLDEIDAVGRKRGSGASTGGHDEREQTLNAILVEMDGFESSDQVIVVAATNRADVLDPALTRPGRFDRQIVVPLPDVQGRLEILQVHARKVKLSPDVDLEKLARGTPMFSGADLAAIINEAAIIATLENKDWVEQADLEEARDKVRFGRAYKSRKIEETERIGTAYHEAGHAVLQKLLPDADPLHKVTIIPRGQALGATMSLPEKDRYGYGMRYMKAMMRVLCGGRIAEQRKTGDVSSGAAMDIRMASRFARHMVLEWGMSERLGFVDYASPMDREVYFPEKPYSEQTARVIDEEVKRLIDEAYDDSERLVDENWDKIVAISEALLKYETLTAEEVDRIMKGERFDKPTVSELLDAETARLTAKRPSPRKKDEPGTEPGPGPIPSPA